MAEVSAKKHSKSILKTSFNILFFIIVTSLSLYYVLKDDPKEAFALIGELDFFPMIFAILAVIGINLLEGVAIYSLTRIYDKKYHYYQGAINAIIGNFTGVFNKTSANFVQAITFTKQGIKGSHAASILTMDFLMYQLTLTLYSLVMVFVGYPFVKDIPLELFGGLKIFPISLIGFFIILFFLIIIILLAFCRPLHRFVLNVGVGLLSKLHILKDPEETRKKWTLTLATYRIESKRLFSHKLVAILVFFIELAKLILSNSIPFFCFWALKADMSQVVYLNTLCGSSYLSLITSFLTTGAPEIGFQAIMMGVTSCSNSLATASNLLWRGLTFYLNLLVGALAFLFYRGSPKKYDLLSNTATMYDLEVLNLNDNPDEGTMTFLRAVSGSKNKKDDNIPLLTQEQIDESFARIRRNMTYTREEHFDIPKKEMTMTLEKQKIQLAKAVAEAQELMRKNKVDEEIAKETQNELATSLKKKQRKETAKVISQKRKEEKRTLKAKKKLEKMQPAGTTLFYDENKGIEIKGPEIMEEKTLTSHDERDSKGKKD